MLCPKCQNQNLEGAKVCEQCGASLKLTSQFSFWKKPVVQLVTVILNGFMLFVVAAVFSVGFKESKVSWIGIFQISVVFFFTLYQIIKFQMLSYKPAKIAALITWSFVILITIFGALETFRAE